MSLQDRKIVQRKRHIRHMEKKIFGKEENNFIGLDEFIDEEVAD